MLLDLASRKIMYTRDVVFKEVRRKSEPKVMVQTKNNPYKVRFEPMNKEEYDSDESTELDEEVEQSNPVLRRYE